MKKSETLEVRIPYETKQAFLTACREDGTTASEVVRTSVQTYLDERERPPQQQTQHLTGTLIMKFPEPVRRYGPRAAAGAVAALGLATFAVLPSAAAPDFQAAFKKLDANGDGVLSADEFTGAKKDGETKDVFVQSHVVEMKGDSAKTAPLAAGAPGAKEDAFTFWLPEELGGTPDAAAQQKNEYRVITRSEVRIETGDKPSPEKRVMTVSIDDLRKREFESFDNDRDGKVSYSEFSGRQRAMMTRGFEILDANGDKSLSQDEYAKIVAPPMPKFPGHDDKDVEIKVQGVPKVSAEAVKAAFAKLDINKDNKLSLQEYLPPA